MGISLDSGAGVIPAVRTSVPSSAGMPLMPFTPIGMLQVPATQLEQFIRGFPAIPGVQPAVQAVQTLTGDAAAAFQRGVASGEVPRILGAIARQLAVGAPVVGEAVGTLVSVSGVVAQVAAPFANAIPYVGAVASPVLSIYAPLATVGGTTIKAISAAGAAMNAAAAGAQLQAAQNAAAAAAGPMDPSDISRAPDPAVGVARGPNP